LNILFTGFVMGLLVGLISLPVLGVSAVLLAQGITFWPLYAAAAILSDILEQSTTVLSLVIYLSILRTLE